MQPKIDGLSIAALALILFLSVSLLTDASNAEASFDPAGTGAAAATTQPALAATLIAPYETYTLTQGPHGQSYGHLAVDLAAGEGAVILAPIQGIVNDRYEDVWQSYAGDRE
jgi:murein DD-endopeptidase MepM/ murein hydrolase activator NlpD